MAYERPDQEKVIEYFAEQYRIDSTHIGRKNFEQRLERIVEAMKRQEKPVEKALYSIAEHNYVMAHGTE